ncbi:MAG TPA: hypothetical protein PLL33_07090 [Paracoccus sp. (in: a-proteobacteria)]|nr:hypothetical protein [Paracoccus sp. (in: a-proteobacteria)]
MICKLGKLFQRNGASHRGFPAAIGPLNPDHPGVAFGAGALS